MTTLTERIIEGKMKRNAHELETGVLVSGQIFESVTLGLGDTTLAREVLPNGSRGEIRISTQENDDVLATSTKYQKYLLSEGGLSPDVGSGERTIGSVRKLTVLAKIAFGRVNHWDKESDFHGTFIEYDEE